MSASEMDSLTLIREVIGKYCDAAPEAVTPDATLADLEVDSLSLAEMLFALEDTIGTPIAEPTERPKTVADLQRLIEPFMSQLLSKVGQG